MLCKTCQHLLFKHRGRIQHGSSSWNHLQFTHLSPHELLDSADLTSCYICRTLERKIYLHGITKQDLQSINYETQNGEQKPFLTATLRYVAERDLYRLDFSLKGEVKLATFALTKADPDSLPPISEMSESTESNQSFDLAKRWIDECLNHHVRCRKETAWDGWYPTRLVDVGQADSSGGITDHVKVVVTQDSASDEPRIHGPYLTLSHCWGSLPFATLTRDTLPLYQSGTAISSLPKTFQHAIEFTRRLGIRYIWIDCFCIIQEDEQDWLYESAQMDKVYSNAYCNISATAAADGTQGLFRTRQPWEWLEVADVSTKGLPGQHLEIQTCTILDVSFWDDIIERAPLTQRSWVLQERLLAPRVIHFCSDQIAFECREMDAAECRPEGLPHYQLKDDAIVGAARFKGIDPSIDGKTVRELRFQTTKEFAYKKLGDPVSHLLPQIYFYELWKRIVETYSKMALTNPADRLVALSGIAKMMSRRTDDQYIAGLWRKFLPSQLLWSVNASTQSVEYFPFELTRPDIYRAPSFSWASIETERGVTFAETTDQGLLIDVKLVQLNHRTKDKFGIVTGGCLYMTGILKEVLLSDSCKQESNRYSWRLARNGEPHGTEFKIVLLDSPADEPSIFGVEGRVYCVPAAIDDSKLTCLLLQLVDPRLGTYRRVGLTEILVWCSSDVDSVLELPSSEATPTCSYYWDTGEEKAGHKTICLT